MAGKLIDLKMRRVRLSLGQNYLQNEVKRMRISGQLITGTQ